MKITQQIPVLMLVALCWASQAQGQVPPSATELASYRGLLAAAHKGDMAEINRLVSAQADLKQTDGRGRTAMHVAAFASHDEVVTALAKAGADPNLLENDKYDIITIAAVANDADMVRTAIRAGGNAKNITSIYDGTALIAAAHLGNWESVQVLIGAGAPLDHVNNLGWTALIEAVVLGDGGPRHVKTAKLLVEAGADRSITDRNGKSPLELARERGYREMIRVLMP
ncbi:ankyrin repeat domain-containing protein [Anderseniella sp. Alg231-50]|uniref:ankyrin repeat domain-containing protein n=1 Tax=Anderseniella sp. Alg231-50 TaxID=1922226 RepID=UPI000D54DAA7